MFPTVGLTYLVRNATPRGSDWLSKRERAVLSGMRFTRRRSSWRLGRWTAKAAVAQALRRADTAGIEILSASDGAPDVFVDDRAAELTLSLSHARGRCACVVAARGIAVGCDIEVVEDRGGVLARDYFNDPETELVQGIRGDVRPLVETLIWSAKESALKALRDGLRRDTRDVEALPTIDERSVDSRDWKPLTVRLPGGDAMSGWWRSDGRFVYTVVTGRAADVLHG